VLLGGACPADACFRRVPLSGRTRAPASADEPAPAVFIDPPVEPRPARQRGVDDDLKVRKVLEK
jgi:hypothetical protein